MSKISIIVPVYKTPQKKLYKCINSIISQTFEDIEAIFIDDGSPDDCGAILESFAFKDSRIIVIHQKNGGLSSARNAGYSASTGEWITFVDADDYIERDACERLLAAVQDHDTQLVMCGLYRDYNNSSTPYKFYIEEKTYVGDECKWLQEQLLHYNGNIAFPISKLIKRDFLEQYNIMHDEVLRQGAEGLEFNFRLFDHLEKAVFINEPLYHYVYNETSITAIFTLEKIKQVIDCYEKIESYVMKGNNSERLLPWFHNRMMYIVITTTISGFFSPSNDLKFCDRVKEMEEFLELRIVKESINSMDFFDLSKARRIVLWFIKHKCYIALFLLGKIRRYQKQHL